MAEKVVCPECQKTLSRRYLKTHIAKIHQSKESPAYKKEVLVAAQEILTTRVYRIPEGQEWMAEFDDWEFISSPKSTVNKTAGSSPGNTEEATAEISADKTSMSDGKAKRKNPEEVVQKKLEKSLGGGHQQTDAGIIDILTETEIVEIKEWKNWKEAIGQLIAYGHYYPNHQKRMHLFGETPNEKLRAVIFTICAENRIRVTFEKAPTTP